MRKRIGLFLAILACIVCFTLLLSACSEDGAGFDKGGSVVTPDENGDDTKPPEVEKYYFVTFYNATTIGSKEEKSYISGAEVTKTAATLTGYRFIKWECGDKTYDTRSITFTVSADMLFNAVYSKLYTVTLEKSGGAILDEHDEELNLSSIEVVAGEIKSLPIPKKQHFIFICWKTDDGEIYDGASNFSTAQDITLTAVFEEKPIYSLTVINADGTDTSVREVHEDEVISVSAERIIGKLCTGWKNGDGELLTENSSLEYTIKGDITLEAIYQTSYRVNTNGYAGTGEYLEGSNISVRLTYVLPGKTFKGWLLQDFTPELGTESNYTLYSSNPDVYFFKTEYEFVITNIDRNYILTAVWENIVYSVTYLCDDAVYEIQYYFFGESIVIPAVDPSAPHKGFTGWTEGLPSDYKMPTNNLVVKGRLFTRSYSLTVTGGTTFDGKTSYLYNTAVTVSAYTATGHESTKGQRFIRWVNLDTNIPYDTGLYGEVAIFVTESPLRIKAEYEWISYTLNYIINVIGEYHDELLDINGAPAVIVDGRFVYKSVIKHYNEPILNEKPVKESVVTPHYTFGDWGTQPAAMPEGNYNVFGTFTCIKYLINVTGGIIAGTDNATQIYAEYNSFVTVIATPEIGKEFTSWVTGSGSGTLVSNESEYEFPVKGNISLRITARTAYYAVTYRINGKEMWNVGDTERSVNEILAEILYLNGNFKLQYPFNAAITVPSVQDISVLNALFEGKGAHYRATTTDWVGLPTGRIMPANPITLDLTIVKRTYSLTVNVGSVIEIGGVAVSPASTTVQEYGTEITIRANSISGKSFDYWTGFSTSVTSADTLSDGTYTFILDGNKTLTANHFFITYYAHYYVDGVEIESLKEPFTTADTRLTLRAAPVYPVAEIKDHYNFNGWYWDYEGNPKYNPLQTLPISVGDMRFDGYFEAKTYDFLLRNGRITAAVLNGIPLDDLPLPLVAGSADTRFSFVYGTVLTISADVPEGKYFVRWADASDETLSTQQTLDVTVSENSLRYRAIFDSLVYSVILTDGFIMSATIGGITNNYPQNTTSATGIKWDSSVIISAKKAETGKEFVKWQSFEEDEWIDFNSAANATFNIKKNYVLRAIYGDTEYSVTFIVACEGQTAVNVLTLNSVLFGETVTIYDLTEFAAQLAEYADYTHYEFVGWYCAEDNTLSGFDYPYSFSLPAKSLTFIAEYKFKYYTVSVTGGTGGGQYKFNTFATVNAVPPTGYKFDKWTSGGVKIDGATSTYSFKVGGDTDLTAEFVQIDYTLTFKLFGATHSEGGDVVETLTLHYDDDISSVYFDPPEITGYFFTGWKFEDGDVPLSMPNGHVVVEGSYISIFKFTNVSGGYSVSANSLVTSGKYPASITIPSTYNGGDVIAIAANGFANLNITNVIIPDSIMTIGNGAFSSNPIINITLPAFTRISGIIDAGLASLISVTVTNQAIISDFAFSGNNALNDNYDNIETITYSKPVTVIGTSAFAYCTALKNLNIDLSGCTLIGQSAFAYAESIEDLEIAETITEIGIYAFYGMLKLSTFIYNAECVSDISAAVFTLDTGISTNFEVTFGENVKKIPANLFYNAVNATFGALPSALEIIGADAFKNSGITSVVLGENITEIGANAFSGAENLITVSYNVKESNISSFNDLTKLFEGAGSSISGLAVTFGNNVTKIPAYIFADSNLSTVSYTANIVSIGAFAYYGTCLVNAVIGETVTAIGERAFAEIDLLESVTFVGNLVTAFNKIFENSGASAEASVDEYTHLPSGMFENFIGLTEILIKITVTNIGENAFIGCKNLIISCEAAAVPTSWDDDWDIIETSPSVRRLEAGVNLFFDIGSQTYGDFSYVVSKGNVYLTSYSDTGSAAVTVPDVIDGYPVVSIGSVFANNALITGVILPDSVKTLLPRSFINCVLLESFYGAGIREMGEDAFFNCPKLQSVIIDELEEFYKIVDGVIFNTDCSILVFCPSSFAHAGGIYTVPLSVNNIAPNAFNGNLSIKTLKINHTVTIFGENCFYNMSGVTALYIGSNVNSLPSGIFAGLTNVNFLDYRAEISDLTGVFDGLGSDADDITVVAGSMKIGKNFLSGHANVTALTLESGVKEILANAFKGIGITALVLPETVITVGNEAFALLTDLVSLTVQSDFTAGADVFVDLGSGALGASVIFASGVSKISDNIFNSEGVNIVSLSLPSTLIEIGNNAFNSLPLSSMPDLSLLTSLTRLGAGAFKYVAVLESVTILVLPDSLEYIGAECFLTENGLISLTALTIGANVATIGSKAFFGLDNVETLYLNSIELDDFSASNGIFGRLGTGVAGGAGVIIGLGVTRVPAYLLFNGGVIDVAYITVNSLSITHVGDSAFKGLTAVTAIVLPATLTHVGASAFENCTNLTTAGITEKVTYIGASAFKNCANLIIEVPESVVTIGSEAFRGCELMTEILIGLSVESLGAGAFAGTINVDTVYYYTENTITDTLGNATSDFVGVFHGSGMNTSGITLYIKNATSIPAFIFHGGKWDDEVNYFNLIDIVFEDDAVESIGAYAFYKSMLITDLVLGGGVKSIGDYAFYSSEKIETVALPATLKTIGAYAFANLALLEIITLPQGLLTIGSFAFAGAVNLIQLDFNVENCTMGDTVFARAGTQAGGITVTFGAAVVLIPNGIFYDSAVSTRANIATVTVTAADTEVGANAFREMDTLTTIIGFGNIVKVGASSFENTALTGVSTENLVIIGANAFKNTSLDTIVLNAELNEIGDGAFSNLTNVTSLTINSVALGNFENGNTVFENLGKDVPGIALTIAKEVTCIPDYFFTTTVKFVSIFRELYADSIRTNFAELYDLMYIGTAAFKNCIFPSDYELNLANININEGNVNAFIIGDSAFEGTSGIITVNLSFVKAEQGKRMFANSTVQSIVIENHMERNKTIRQWHIANQRPEYHEVADYTVTFAEYSFSNCSSLISVYFEDDSYYLPSGDAPVFFRDAPKFISILAHAFEGCVNLVGSFENVAEVGAYAFSGCTNLESVSFLPYDSGSNGILNKFAILGDYAFKNCENLSITGNFSGVEQNHLNISVGAYAFSGVDASKTSFTIKNAYLTEIGEHAFVGKDGKSVLKSNSVLTIQSITSIGSYAFAADFTGKIIFETAASIETIGDYAFGSASLAGFDSVGIIILEGLRSVGEKAFSNFTGEIIINSCSFTYVGDSAFYNDGGIPNGENLIIVSGMLVFDVSIGSNFASAIRDNAFRTSGDITIIINAAQMRIELTAVNSNSDEGLLRGAANENSIIYIAYFDYYDSKDGWTTDSWAFINANYNLPEIMNELPDGSEGHYLMYVPKSREID